MVISLYQVNNVLRVYGEQLRQTSTANRAKSVNTRSPDSISISAEAKRKVIVDKVTSDILDIARNSPADLIFKVVDENGETVNSLSIEDSEFLRYKLEKIAKNTVNKNMM